MKRLAILAVLAALVGGVYAADKAAPAADKDGWFSLFDGKTLDGWKVNTENPATFKVEDGCIVTNGPRTHLFYAGPVQNANFKNFEFQCQVMTFPGSNSGVYFHTEYQDKGWPVKGYECQVNNTHSDPKKTGGLYAIKDCMEAPAKDNEWFTYYIKVEGKHAIIKINGKVTADFTEPDGYAPPKGMEGRKISSGTFAIQGHDPKSKVMFKDIKVKPL